MRRVGVAIALVLSAAYGAGTQFLGARVPGWGPDVAMLSAPWLLIAFLAGSTQKTPRRAALLGLGATAAALTGYWLMTDSPVEGAQYTLANAHGFLVSNTFTVVGGLVSGPLFGWFGHRWRTRGALLGALVTAAALCLEPLARRVPFGDVRAFGHGYVVANPIGSHAVIVVEFAVGLLLGAAILVRHRREALRPPD
jgi:hypothetical protein